MSDAELPQEPDRVPSTYDVSRWLYFRLLGFIYVAAFLSFCPQILGLIGSKGIVPVKSSLTWVSDYLGWQAFFQYPTVFWLDSSDKFLSAVPVIGVVFGGLCILGVFTQASVLASGLLYLSLVTVGDDFTGFQSDGMLVEVSFLSLFLVSWRQLLAAPWPLARQGIVRHIEMEQPASGFLKPHWLLWFLLFRIMFGAGAVKILSGDETWRNLTALSFHYETQPLPTPLAWFAYQMPMWFHQVSVVGTLAIEVMLPFLIFFPGRWRLAVAAGTMLLQFSIILTGNYTFLNWLLIVLCVPLLDDSTLSRILPSKLKLIENIKSRIIFDPAVFQSKSIFLKYWRLGTASAVTMLIVLFLLLGASRLSAMLGLATIVPPTILAALGTLQNFHVVGGYGMFGVMTTSRPEIVIEGSDDGINWLEYDFKFKPGDPSRAPCWVAPHLPRLDWRLWFAAMEPQQGTLWFVPLMKRLLENDQAVVSLLRVNPFSGRAPKMVRAWVYDYHFTDANDLEKTGRWWRRDNKQVFLPPIDLEGPVFPGDNIEKLK